MKKEYSTPMILCVKSVDNEPLLNKMSSLNIKNEYGDAEQLSKGQFFMDDDDSESPASNSIWD